MTDKWKDGCIEVKSDRLFAQAPPLPPPTQKKSIGVIGTKVIILHQSNRIDF